jgi:hypothetical protein
MFGLRCVSGRERNYASLCLFVNFGTQVINSDDIH